MIPFDFRKTFKSRKYLQVLLRWCLSEKKANCFTNHQLEARKTRPFILYGHRSLLKTFCSHSSPGRQADYANMANLTQLLSLRAEKQAWEKAVLMLPCSMPQRQLLWFLTIFSSPSICLPVQMFIVLHGLRGKNKWIIKCLLINKMVCYVT